MFIYENDHDDLFSTQASFSLPQPHQRYFWISRELEDGGKMAMAGSHHLSFKTALQKPMGVTETTVTESIYYTVSATGRSNTRESTQFGSASKEMLLPSFVCNSYKHLYTIFLFS